MCGRSLLKKLLVELPSETTCATERLLAELDHLDLPRSSTREKTVTRNTLIRSGTILIESVTESRSSAAQGVRPARHTAEGGGAEGIPVSA